MKQKYSTYLFTLMSWINVVVLAPLIFVTIIFNAQVAVPYFHTNEVSKIMVLYIAQIVLLACVFLPATFLQMQRADNKKIKMVNVIMLESIILFLLGMSMIVQTKQIHTYGWILMRFLPSYIGIALLSVNIALGLYLIERKAYKTYWSRATISLLICFMLSVICIYFLK